MIIKYMIIFFLKFFKMYDEYVYRFYFKINLSIKFEEINFFDYYII